MRILEGGRDKSKIPVFIDHYQEVKNVCAKFAEVKDLSSIPDFYKLPVVIITKRAGSREQRLQISTYFVHFVQYVSLCPCVHMIFGKKTFGPRHVTSKRAPIPIDNSGKVNEHGLLSMIEMILWRSKFLHSKSNFPKPTFR